ncbi:hypothetical protein V8O11_14745 [Erwinia aphidicola]|uniref:hypothetical protein n=1 Tax=Erwinia aphidicola TaxID=68334 RepID=UPI00300CF671
MGDFEHLFCHVMTLQDEKWGDPILMAGKISIYLTKPLHARNSGCSRLTNPVLAGSGAKPGETRSGYFCFTGTSE